MIALYVPPLVSPLQKGMLISTAGASLVLKGGSAGYPWLANQNKASSGMTVDVSYTNGEDGEVYFFMIKKL